MISTLDKAELDRLWVELETLEAMEEPKFKDKCRAADIRHTLEMNARRITWVKRGFTVVNGGKANEEQTKAAS